MMMKMISSEWVSEWLMGEVRVNSEMRWSVVRWVGCDAMMTMKWVEETCKKHLKTNFDKKLDIFVISEKENNFERNKYIFCNNAGLEIKKLIIKSCYPILFFLGFKTNALIRVRLKVQNWHKVGDLLW